MDKTAIFLVLLCALSLIGSLKIEQPAQTPRQTSTIPSIPVQTDDGLDPINLVFTGYAPSWWVAANMVGWSDSAYCSGPKTVDGEPYNYTLEHPDPTGIACIGPRDHIRIWDMGYSPILGEWSIAAVHHERTVCNPICHHVIDNWNSAETDATSAFLNSQATLSASNYTLGNAGYYQGIYYNGNATMIRLKPPSNDYPVVFNENGLGNQTSWGVTINGVTTSSTRPDFVVEEQDGVYPFSVSIPAGFASSPSSGTIVINGGATQNIHFRTPWTTSSATVSPNSQTVSIGFNGNATVATSSVQLSTGGYTTIRFTVSEIGGLGALNVTIPKSIAPSDASSIVDVDGSRDNSVKLTSDASNYYLYFFLLYGMHSVQLQLSPPTISYFDYTIGGALATGILGVLFTAFRSKTRRKTNVDSERSPRDSSAGSITLNNRHSSGMLCLVHA